MQQLLSIDPQSLTEWAEQAFRELSGINRSPVKLASLLEKGLALRAQFGQELDCRVVWDQFSSFSLVEDCLTINGIPFICTEFSHYQPWQIKRIYAYLLTGPSWQVEDGVPTIELLLKTNWVSAYVMSAFKGLRQYFEQQISDGENLSVSFAPGFNGMNTDMIAGFFQILDGSAIGVTLVDQQIMVPLSSCVGLYLVIGE
ncbi:MAG: hypothetical protein RR387_06030 [Clostridiales bacterium]